MTISACIICLNEEQNIKRCLESVLWVDEIIVVDSMSRDKTVEIARQYTRAVFEKPWEGYAKQKNFAVSKASGTWVLSLDADEEVTPALREEIQGEIEEGSGECAGYRIPRLSFYQGRWIRHSGFYPDRQLRLFRRELGKWVGGRVHERVEVKGKVCDLKNDLLHYPYKGTIAGQLDTVNNFSTLLAQDMYEKGKRYRVHLLVFRPLFKFAEVYLLKGGFLDGLAGFVIAVSSSYAMFVRYVKLREIEAHHADYTHGHK